MLGCPPWVNKALAKENIFYKLDIFPNENFYVQADRYLISKVDFFSAKKSWKSLSQF